MSYYSVYHKFQKCRKKLFMAAFAVLLLFSAKLLYASVPDEVYVVRGKEDELHFSVPVTLEKEEASIAVFQNTGRKTGEINGQREDYKLSCKFLNFIPVKEVSVHVVEKTYVMPSGMPIGVYTKTNGILIIGTGKVTSANGLNYEPADELVMSGDYIMKVNGQEVFKKEELIRIVNQSKGEAVVLEIIREGKQIELKIDPVALEDGSYKLGIWVRDDMAGVGTLTYIEENLEYGALGHPVSDADTGNTISLLEGNVYHTDIVGIVKGENGSPGELTGVINYNEKYCLGTIYENTKTGIYGKLKKVPINMKGEYLEAGMKQDIERGKAYILSSLDGTLQQYEVEIDEVDFNNREENKGILFHVTDVRLLSKTGGVVQGMSGSPLVQNGKIIGAVTHVFVSDASKGYGVFIENMLEH